MSSDEQDDDITIVTPRRSEYAASQPGTSPHKVKTGKPRLPEAERLCHDAIVHYNVDAIVYLKTPQQQKRHIFKKSLFSSSQDDTSMSTSADPVKAINRRRFVWAANIFNS